MEDLHWADEATLDMVAFLGRRLALCRALLILTYRDDEVGPDHQLRTVLAGLPRGPGPAAAACPPLSAAAVDELARRAGRPASSVLRGDRRQSAAGHRAAGRGRLGRARRPSATWCCPAWPRCRPRRGRSPASCPVVPSQAEPALLASARRRCRGVPRRRGAERERRRRRVPARAAAAGGGGGVVPGAPGRPARRRARPARRPGRGGPGPARAPRAPRRGRRGGAALGAGRRPARGRRSVPTSRPRPTTSWRCGTLPGLPRPSGPTCWRRTRPSAYLAGLIGEALEARRLGAGPARAGRRHRTGRREPALALPAQLVDRATPRRPGWPAERAVEVLESIPPGPQLAMAYSNLSQLHMLAGEDAGDRVGRAGHRPRPALRRPGHRAARPGQRGLGADGATTRSPAARSCERAHDAGGRRRARRPCHPVAGQQGLPGGRVVRLRRRRGRAGTGAGVRRGPRPGRLRPAPARLPGRDAAGPRRLGRRPRRRGGGRVRPRPARTVPGHGAGRARPVALPARRAGRAADILHRGRAVRVRGERAAVRRAGRDRAGRALLDRRRPGPGGRRGASRVRPGRTRQASLVHRPARLLAVAGRRARRDARADRRCRTGC